MHRRDIGIYQARIGDATRLSTFCRALGPRRLGQTSPKLAPWVGTDEIDRIPGGTRLKKIESASR